MGFLIRQNFIGAKCSQAPLPGGVPQDSEKHWVSELGTAQDLGSIGTRCSSLQAGWFSGSPGAVQMQQGIGLKVHTLGTPVHSVPVVGRGTGNLADNEVPTSPPGKKLLNLTG